MKNFLFVFLFFLLFFLLFIPNVATAREADASSYFSNKVSIDGKLLKLKEREEKQKKIVNDYNSEIDVLKRRLAIFGEADEHESEKIKAERRKLSEDIQKKRAKMLTVMLELSKISDEIAELNASIFEQYVENMRRIDDFVFSKKYLVAAGKGLARLKVQLQNVFTTAKNNFSVATMLKVTVSIFSIVSLFVLLVALRNRIDETLFPGLHFWIKNLMYLLFPVSILICSNLLFSFNFVVNGILFAISVAVMFGTFLRNRIDSCYILFVLSALYGCHILFDDMAADFDIQFELVSIVSAVLIIAEGLLGFLAMRKYGWFRWIFLIPIFMVVVGYVAVANIIMFRGLNVLNITMILISFSIAVNELLKISQKTISRYVSFTKVKIVAEVVVWLVSAYFYIIVFAFIIGLRKNQIVEMNRRLFFDMKVYDMDLSIIHIVFSLIVAFLVTGIIAVINRKIETSDIEESGKYSATVGLKYAGYIIAGLVFLTMIGVTFTSISIIIGALSVGIGFGLQNIVNNFVSGIIILFERPIKVGDWVRLENGNEGKVRNISIRTTTIETFQNAHIIVPNADILSGSFLNWTRRQPFNRLEIDISIALDADPELATKVMMEIAKNEPKVLDKPAPYVIMPDWHDDCIILQLRVYIRNTADRCMVNSNLRYGIVKKFKEYGIDRPIPRRSILCTDCTRSNKTEEKEYE